MEKRGYVEPGYTPPADGNDEEKRSAADAPDPGDDLPRRLARRAAGGPVSVEELDRK